MSNPASKIIWLINGIVASSANETVYQQSNGFISLSNITFNTADVSSSNFRIIVECIAKNNEGTAKKQHTIRILCNLYYYKEKSFLISFFFYLVISSFTYIFLLISFLIKDTYILLISFLNILIAAPPGEPVIYGTDETLLEGEVLNMTCESHGGNPLAALSWYRSVEKVFFLKNLSQS